MPRFNRSKEKIDEACRQVAKEIAQTQIAAENRLAQKIAYYITHPEEITYRPYLQVENIPAVGVVSCPICGKSDRHKYDCTYNA